MTGLVGLKDKYGLDIAPANFVAISDGGGPATIADSNRHGARR